MQEEPREEEPETNVEEPAQEPNAEEIEAQRQRVAAEAKPTAKQEKQRKERLQQGVS